MKTTNVSILKFIINEDKEITVYYSLNQQVLKCNLHFHKQIYMPLIVLIPRETIQHFGKSYPFFLNHPPLDLLR